MPLFQFYRIHISGQGYHRIAHSMYRGSSWKKVYPGWDSCVTSPRAPALFGSIDGRGLNVSLSYTFTSSASTKYSLSMRNWMQSCMETNPRWLSPLKPFTCHLLEHQRVLLQEEPIYSWTTYNIDDKSVLLQEKLISGTTMEKESLYC